MTNAIAEIGTVASCHNRSWAWIASSLTSFQSAASPITSTRCALATAFASSIVPIRSVHLNWIIIRIVRKNQKSQQFKNRKNRHFMSFFCWVRWRPPPADVQSICNLHRPLCASNWKCLAKRLLLSLSLSFTPAWVCWVWGAGCDRGDVIHNTHRRRHPLATPWHELMASLSLSSSFLHNSVSNIASTK